MTFRPMAVTAGETLILSVGSGLNKTTAGFVESCDILTSLLGYGLHGHEDRY